MTQFDYLLNAFEHASQATRPAAEGYADKRKALFAYVRGLEAAAPPVDAQPVGVCELIHPAPADASPAGDPTYTDDLELRYAEVCEERDHLRRALAKPAAPVAQFDMATFQTLMAEYGEAQFMYGEWSADCEDSGQRLCDDVIAKRTALLNYLRQFARRDGEAG